MSCSLSKQAATKWAALFCVINWNRYATPRIRLEHANLTRTSATRCGSKAPCHREMLKVCFSIGACAVTMCNADIACYFVIRSASIFPVSLFACFAFLACSSNSSDRRANRGTASGAWATCSTTANSSTSSSPSSRRIAGRGGGGRGARAGCRKGGRGARHDKGDEGARGCLPTKATRCSKSGSIRMGLHASICRGAVKRAMS